MMSKSKELIVDEVEAVQERLNELETLEDFNPLEWKFTANLDGTVREVVAVLTVGGPHIEANLTRGYIDGYWGSEEATTPFYNDLLENDLEREMVYQFEELNHA